MLSRLPRSEAGIATYAGTVRPWECDRNNHWNVQFYLRAFQMASEILAAAGLGRNPGAASTAFRHFRFHGELFATETMKVVSGRIAEGPMEGHVLHRMVTGPDDRLSATAIEAPAYAVGGLPVIGGELLRKALPGAECHEERRGEADRRHGRQRRALQRREEQHQRQKLQPRAQHMAPARAGAQDRRAPQDQRQQRQHPEERPGEADLHRRDLARQQPDDDRIRRAADGDQHHDQKAGPRRGLQHSCLLPGPWPPHAGSAARAAARRPA